HTVPQEKLVAVGGHTAGSDFELVAWSQGEVRHNLQHSKSNGEATPERKRMLYIVGRILDLEYSLRGLANATAQGKYAENMIQRVQTARSRLKDIFAATKLEAIKELMAATEATGLKANNQAELNQAANAVGEIGRRFSSAHDGTKL